MSRTSDWKSKGIWRMLIKSISVGLSCVQCFFSDAKMEKKPHFNIDTDSIDNQI